LLAVVSSALAGCGGDATTGSATVGSASPPPPRQEAAAAIQGSKPDRNPAEDPVPSQPRGGAHEFEQKGGDNSIPRYGSEADASEIEAAAAVLHDYLDARVAGEWSEVCSTFAAELRSAVRGFGGESSAIVNAKAKSCAETMGKLLTPLPAAFAKDAAAEVAALRVQGDHGFLLFHGLQGVDYLVRMVREGGSWKLEAPAPSELP
jgi:hypothetical protein